MSIPNKIQPISAPEPLQVVHSDPDRFKHLVGMTEDEVRLVKLIAHNFVNSIINKDSK